MRAARFNSVPLALAAVITPILAAGVAPMAHAQTAQPAAVRSIAIASQPLGQALNELARQAHLQLSFAAAAVAGKTAPAVSGQFTPQQALDRLLAGSGLEGSVTGSSALVRPPGSGAGNPTLATVQVTAAATSSLAPLYAGGQTATGSQVGLLGGKDLLETPFSTTAYTAQLIEDQQAQNIGDVLANDPSVRNTYARGAGRDEFNIRGFTLFNYDVSFNGLYGVSPRNASSLIGVERVEVLRGPNALLNGIAPGGSIGGAINLVPKRAGPDPLNRFTLSYIGDGQVGAQADVARRFGPDKQWGARVNVLKRSGDTPLDGSSERLGAFALGLDFEGERVRLEADVGYQDRRTHARSGLLFPPGAAFAIPAAPDNKVNFQPSWTYWDAKELATVVRAEVDLSPELTATAAVGAMKYDFESLATTSQLTNSMGGMVAQPARLREYVDTRTAEAGLRGKFRTGSLQHQAVASITHYTREQGTLRATGALFNTNLYTPANGAAPTIAIGPNIPRAADTTLRSIALADTISTADRRLQFTLGLRHQRVETTSFAAPSSHYDESAVTPLAAVLYKATSGLVFYGNYVEALNQGPIASGTLNDGAFPPYKSRQVEVGAKFDTGRFATTLSLFQIERPSSITLPGPILTMDGEQRNRGIELLTQGELATGVRLLAGMAYTDGKLTRTQGGLSDGRTAPATPRVQVNVAGEWDTPFAPGLTLTARVLQTGSQYVNTANTQELPSWTRWDLGARYRFNSGGVPVTLRAAIENVFDKDDWQSAARGTLSPGAPRTLLLSVSADF